MTAQSIALTLPGVSVSTIHENPTSPGFIPPDSENRAGNEKLAQKALRLTLDGFEQARNARAGRLEERWERSYRAWRTDRNRKGYRGRANITDPEPFRAVETITARLEEAVLSQRPWVRVLPRDPSDMEQAEKVEGLIQFQIDVSSGDRVVQSFLRSLVIYGTAIMRVNWAEEYIKRGKRKKNKPSPLGIHGMALEGSGRDELSYRGPQFRNVDISDFYIPDLFEEDLDKQAFVIERRVVTYRDLFGMSRRGLLKNVERLKEEPFSPEPKFHDLVKQQRAMAAGIPWEPVGHDDVGLKKVEVLVYEGGFDIDGDGIEEDCWIWVANGKHVLYLAECPYWHGLKSYVYAPYIRAPGEFYGMSAFDPIEQLWHEVCDKHNQALDNANLLLNPAMLAGIGANLEQSQLMLSPGRVVQSKGDVNQIKPLQFPDSTPAAYNAIGVLQRSIRETTGATDLMQGQSPGAVDKATIFAGLLNEASMRMRHPLRNIFGCVEALVRRMYGLNQQYIQEQEVVRVLGRDGFKFIPVRPEDLQTDVDFRGIGTGVLSTLLQKNFALERFVATATPLIQAGLAQVDIQELLKRYWTDALGYTDAERVFGRKGPQPLDPRQENLLLIQRQGVDVHPEDDDLGHVKAHISLLQHEDEVVQEMVREHISDHRRRYMAKQQIMLQRAAMQEEMQKAQLAGMQSKGSPAGGSPSPTPTPPVGNQRQFGPEIGAVKQMGERLAGRMG